MGVECAIYERANAALTVGAKKKYFEGKVSRKVVTTVKATYTLNHWGSQEPVSRLVVSVCHRPGIENVHSRVPAGIGVIHGNCSVQGLKATCVRSSSLFEAL